MAFKSIHKPRIIYLNYLFICFLIVSQSADAFNSYVYLPDKYIQEEISVGSLILDVSEEITNYLHANKHQQHQQQQQQQSQGSSHEKGKLSQNDLGFDGLDTTESQHYTFLEDTKSSAENTYFLLDSITGRITSKRYLDRESMCLNKHCMEACDIGAYQSSIHLPPNLSALNTTSSIGKVLGLDNSARDKTRSINGINLASIGNCKMNLKVLIIPSYSIVSLNIIVQDINDNKPQFRIDYINQSIPENVPIGYKIPIDLAYDPDIGLNSIQYYTLVHSSAPVISASSSSGLSAGTRVGGGANNDLSDFIKETFSLIQNLNESQLALVVKRKLDREKVAQYNLTIAACDGGTPSNCGQLKLILNIVDINDHNPTFLKEIYSFSVIENMPTGTLIGQVAAYDLDDGQNGQIKYTLSGSGNILSNSLINPSSIGDSFASDMSAIGQMQRQINSNMAAPVLVQNNILKYFDLDANTGLLRLNAPLDYETQPYISLTVEARDCGIGSLPAYATIEIFVLDANDNSPEISVSFLNSLSRNLSTIKTPIEATSKERYGGYSSSLSDESNVTTIMNVYIKENYEPNKFIAHVSIFDRDSTENARLDWKVLINNRQVQLASSSSSVETSETIELNKRQDSREIDQLLTVSKLNSNSFTINTGPNSDKLFDREKICCINVSIVSWDFGTQPKSNMATYNFRLVLIDENDNPPKFDKANYELTINENNNLDQVIYQFKATDLDINENGQIIYSIDDSLEKGSKNESSMSSESFEKQQSQFVYIEPTTGILRAARVFDREEKSSYEFYVIGRDSSIDVTKRLWSKVKCVVNVIDLNDNTPRIFYNNTSLPYKDYSNKTTLALRLDENIPVQTQLVKFHCDDSDHDLNGQTKFLLLNSNPQLSNSQLQIGQSSENTKWKEYDETESDLYGSLNLDSSGIGFDPRNLKSEMSAVYDLLPFKLSDDGKLYVSKRLDRETQETYDLKVVCYDQASRSTRLNSTINLIIKLNDVNDNCPRSSNQSIYYLSKDEQTVKTKFLNKNSISVTNLVDSFNVRHNLKASNQSFNIFTANYTDLDIGKNGELKFELQSHLDIFKLNVIEPLSHNLTNNNEHMATGSIYTLQIQFKQPPPNGMTNYNNNNNKTTATSLNILNKFIDFLKIGKYVIKVKISDNGYPSCIKTDSFVLYLGNNDLRTQETLIDRLKSLSRIKNDNNNQFDTLANYINDEEDTSNEHESIERVKLVVTNINGKLAGIKSSFGGGGSGNFSESKSVKSGKAKSNDHLVLLCLIATLAVVAILLSLVGAIYFYKRYLRKRERAQRGGKYKGSKKSPADLLKVKNYREIELNDGNHIHNNDCDVSGGSSSSSSGNSNEEENENQCEINNLLDHDANANRLSLSLKSTDQSQSADSVISQMTLHTRDSNLSNLPENHHLIHDIHDNHLGLNNQHQHIHQNHLIHHSYHQHLNQYESCSTGSSSSQSTSSNSSTSGISDSNQIFSNSQRNSTFLVNHPKTYRSSIEHISASTSPYISVATFSRGVYDQDFSPNGSSSVIKVQSKDYKENVSIMHSPSYAAITKGKTLLTNKTINKNNSNKQQIIEEKDSLLLTSFPHKLNTAVNNSQYYEQQQYKPNHHHHQYHYHPQHQQQQQQQQQHQPQLSPSSSSQPLSSSSSSTSSSTITTSSSTSTTLATVAAAATIIKPQYLKSSLNRNRNDNYAAFNSNGSTNSTSSTNVITPSSSDGSEIIIVPSSVSSSISSSSCSQSSDSENSQQQHHHQQQQRQHLQNKSEQSSNSSHLLVNSHNRYDRVMSKYSTIGRQYVEIGQDESSCLFIPNTSSSNSDASSVNASTTTANAATPNINKTLNKQNRCNYLRSSAV